MAQAGRLEAGQGARGPDAAISAEVIMARQEQADQMRGGKGFIAAMRDQQNRDVISLKLTSKFAAEAFPGRFIK